MAAAISSSSTVTASSAYRLAASNVRSLIPATAMPSAIVRTCGQATGRPASSDGNNEDAPSAWTATSSASGGFSFTAAPMPASRPPPPLGRGERSPGGLFERSPVKDDPRALPAFPLCGRRLGDRGPDGHHQGGRDSGQPGRASDAAGVVPPAGGDHPPHLFGIGGEDLARSPPDLERTGTLEILELGEDLPAESLC